MTVTEGHRRLNHRGVSRTRPWHLDVTVGWRALQTQLSQPVHSERERRKQIIIPIDCLTVASVVWHCLVLEVLGFCLVFQPGMGLKWLKGHFQALRATELSGHQVKYTHLLGTF